MFPTGGAFLVGFPRRPADSLSTRFLGILETRAWLAASYCRSIGFALHFPVEVQGRKDVSIELLETIEA